MRENTKFQRAYELTMEVVSEAGALERVTVKLPLSVSFNVRRDNQTESQGATFQIRNLSEKTRNRMFKDLNTAIKIDGEVVRQKITFRAGYGDYLPIVFDGYVQSCYSYREEVDFITEIECYDGGLAMARGYIVGSQPFNSREEIITFLSKQLPGLENSTPIILRGTPKDEPLRPVVLVGNIWDLIQTYADGKAFIDNGQLKVLEDNYALKGEIPEISSASGLLGSPRRGKSRIELDMLFEPRLLNGQSIKLNSTTQTWMNNQYRVCGFTHTGTISPAVGEACRTHVILFGPLQAQSTGGTIA